MSKKNAAAASGWIDRIASRPYSDWFGKGDAKEDVVKIIKQHGEPKEVLFDGYMACLTRLSWLDTTGANIATRSISQELNHEHQTTGGSGQGVHKVQLCWQY